MVAWLLILKTKKLTLHVKEWTAYKNFKTEIIKKQIKKLKNKNINK